ETTDLQLNVFADFDPQLPQAYRDADYCFLANGSPAIQHGVIDQLSNPTLVLADTMNHWIQDTHDDVIRMLGRVNGVIINDEEAQMLAERKNLVAAARAVQRMGPDIVVVKKGAHGCLILADDAVVPIPAWPLDEVHDPTGAGDCFAGAFMGYLAQRGDHSPASLRKAAVYGTLVASFNCEAFSVNRLRALSREDIEERARIFADMLRV
ncbi:MAG: PfkB family carbohydrate kinase, partial [Planctomycetota bacterium]